MIPITKPFLPPLEAYQSYVKEIWGRNLLTNNGPLLKELEQKLGAYLDVKHLLYVSNGTIALQIAIKILKLHGEIITTPFSYVATTSSIVWEHCTPVFVDIDPDSLNIDASKIEAAITPSTSAIIATHVYGNPCEIEAIGKIAKQHNLKVIYDAAHAFGVKYQGRSIYSYGDISTASFHATKLYHTIEGGAIITNDASLANKTALARNFGHNGPAIFDGVGINGKNSEFHAAMGLCNLPYIDDILKQRRSLATVYLQHLSHPDICFPFIKNAIDHNYAYFPIILKSESQLLQIERHLKAQQVLTRRYFYPALTQLDYVASTSLPVVTDIAPRIICLPMYHELQEDEVKEICNLIISAL